MKWDQEVNKKYQHGAAAMLGQHSAHWFPLQRHSKNVKPNSLPCTYFFIFNHSHRENCSYSKTTNQNVWQARKPTNCLGAGLFFFSGWLIWCPEAAHISNNGSGPIQNQSYASFLKLQWRTVSTITRHLRQNPQNCKVQYFPAHNVTINIFLRSKASVFCLWGLCWCIDTKHPVMCAAAVIFKHPTILCWAVHP